MSKSFMILISESKEYPGNLRRSLKHSHEADRERKQGITMQCFDMSACSADSQLVLTKDLSLNISNKGYSTERVNNTCHLKNVKFSLHIYNLEL